MPQPADAYVVVPASDEGPPRYALINAQMGHTVRIYRSLELALDDVNFLNRYCLPRREQTGTPVSAVPVVHGDISAARLQPITPSLADRRARAAQAR